jgi:hypothetical protein
LKNRERNEAIEKSVCFPDLTAEIAASTGLCVGVEADPLAAGQMKGQKIVISGGDGGTVCLEFSPLHR